MAVDKSALGEGHQACITRFYKIILSWDYFRLLNDSDKHRRNKNDLTGRALGVRKVKNTYSDVDDYIATFEPLMFEEAKAQIIKGKKDDDEEETEWVLAMVAERSELDGFHLPMVICIDAGSIKQNDLLLVSNQKFEEGKSVPTTYAFALVEHRQQDKIKLRMHLKGEFKELNTDKLVECSRLSNMRYLFSEVKGKLFFLKVCNLSTIAREYVALWSISSLPFKDLILSATQSNLNDDRAWKISKPLKEFIETNHNKSQLEAINAGLSRNTFVLIQGPPGTGKTQTIIGLLCAILHATPAKIHSERGKLNTLKCGPQLSIQDKHSHWLKASPWLTGLNPREQEMPKDGDDGFFPTSGNELRPEPVNSSRKYRVRVLICAPSNSALDEIVLRVLNSGIRDENDHVYNPKIVRIGLKPHHSVQAVSMNYLVEQKMVGLDMQTGDKQKQGETKDIDSIRASVLSEAVIVFSTLSFSGSPLFSKLNHGFDVVIIDEAAQAVEPSTLIPLANGCKQVFLVGDPVQLPATVTSDVAKKFGYEKSLFQRLQMAGYPVQMLKTQYRMHPEIRSFPSREFYDDALEDGPDIEVLTKRKWHNYRCFGPFCFFDIHEGKESKPAGSGSWMNVDEVEFVLVIYRELVTRYPELKSSSKLAIISPYRHQVKIIQQKFREIFGVDSHKFVDVNSVDGFQGREKDVAIFSCVRASEDGHIGFVEDFRRMNVAITRARSSVLVVGSASTLKRDKHWGNLIKSAEERNTLFKVSKPYNDLFNDEKLATTWVTDKAREGMLETEASEMDIDGGAALDAYQEGPELGDEDMDVGGNEED
ncbi:unnamed protein product [Cuscuta epithymum]|uniref:Helicase MAGATAMA 3 n=1 Tax=Cuscuta epithymum TaxID=186058 RepID=A0AAV0CGK1_9ASTE|nr:unnamed protein product [Cuscuta epithymum]